MLAIPKGHIIAVSLLAAAFCLISPQDVLGQSGAGQSAVVLNYQRFGENRYPETNVTANQIDAQSNNSVTEILAEQAELIQRNVERTRVGKQVQQGQHDNEHSGNRSGQPPVDESGFFLFARHRFRPEI